jgi:hypothetical protein
MSVFQVTSKLLTNNDSEVSSFSGSICGFQGRKMVMESQDLDVNGRTKPDLWQVTQFSSFFSLK